MSLYRKARKHFDLDRAKEIHEEKIEQQKIAEEAQKAAEESRQQEQILAVQADLEMERYRSNWRKELKEAMTTDSLGMLNLPAQGNVDLGAAVDDFTLSGLSPHEWNSVTKYLGSERNQYDTLVITVTSNSSEWILVGDDITDTFGSGGVGTKTIVVSSVGRRSIYYSAKDDGSISFKTSYQRRRPVNAFVSLDDPEANSFVRGGLGGDKNRRAQLKDMIESGNQWMYIQGLEPSKATPGDIEIEPAPMPQPKQPTGGNMPIVPSDYQPSDTQVARINDGPMDDPNNIQWPRNNPYKKPQPGPGYIPPVKKAGRQTTMVAHHEPKGKVLKEKKSFKQLREQMTSSGMGFSNLPAVGDVNLENITKLSEPGTAGSGGSNGSYRFGNYQEAGTAGFSIVLDTRKYDTIKFTASQGNATRIELAIGSGGFQTLSNGTNTITIPPGRRGPRTRFIFNAFKTGAESGASGASISGPAFQRRTNINTFVSLEDPDASAFIRGGLGGSRQSRKQFKDSIDSSNALMTKKGFEPSKVSPGDIEIARVEYPKQDPLDKLLKDIKDMEKKMPPGPGRPGKGRGGADTWEGPGKIV